MFYCVMVLCRGVQECTGCFVMWLCDAVQLNGSLSAPYHVNGVRCPVSSVSLSSKKLHQHANGHLGAVATEFSRTPGKKSDGSRTGKSAVVSLEDDFVSSRRNCFTCLH